MAYENNCAACTYLNDNLWCEKKGESHSGSDRKCDSFCEAYGRSTSERENFYESSPSSGCYLTTIMCQILKYPDDNHYLKTLRNFRDTIMQPDPNCLPLLLTYDIIGPSIAKKLALDPRRISIATAFFNDISDAVSAIEEKDYDSAIDKYVTMTSNLAKNLGIDANFANINIANIDKTNLGHGKIRALVPQV